MKYYFKIADIVFSVKIDFPIRWNPYIQKFVIENCQDVQYYYTCQLCNSLPEITGKELYRSNNQIIYKNLDGLEERLHLLAVFDYPIILYKEIGAFEREIYIKKEYLDLVTRPESFSIFNALAAEKVFIEQDAFVLHSAFIIESGQAILFTAPSGTGKSTQADLWSRHNGSVIVNGDRTLIKKKNGKWYGYGFPICGSSQICLNECAPIKSVIYLAQSLENSIEKLPLSQAIKKVMSEVSINFWNGDYVDKAVQIINDFCRDIDIYYSNFPY